MSPMCQKRTHALQQSTSAASSESGQGLPFETLCIASCLTAVVVVTGGLAVGHGGFERDPGDLERLQECRCRVAEYLVGVSAAGCVQCGDAEVPDYLDLRPAGRCLHVAERHHPAVVGFMYIGHVVLHHEGATDHLHVDRHRPAVVGRCCSGGDMIRWCATLVLCVGQVQ